MQYSAHQVQLKFLANGSRFSIVVVRQFRKLKVVGSIPTSGSCFSYHLLWDTSIRVPKSVPRQFGDDPVMNALKQETFQCTGANWLRKFHGNGVQDYEYRMLTHIFVQRVFVDDNSG